MTRGEARLNHAAAFLVGGTGAVWAWMRYLYEAEPTEDEFALLELVAHPWEPLTQSLHILFAPLLVFGCAMIWREHVWKRIRSGFARRRRSGWVLFGLLVPMVASGYLLQVSVNDTLRQVWTYLHVASSLLFGLGYLLHQLAGSGRGGQPRRRGSTGPSGDSTASSVRSP